MPSADTLLHAARGADVSHVVIHSATVILSGSTCSPVSPAAHQLLQLLHRVRFAATIGDGISAAFNPIPQPP